MSAVTVIGWLSSYDMCVSFVYYESCSKIFMWNSIFMATRFAYYFYVAFISASYSFRIQRGEIILVNHGKAIVELISTIQNTQKKNDVELGSVARGVAIGEVSVGESLDITDDSKKDIMTGTSPRTQTTL